MQEVWGMLVFDIDMAHTCHGDYFASRYYGPNPKMNGNTVHDILFKGTKLAAKFKATRF
jgi:hypothetical protein